MLVKFADSTGKKYYDDLACAIKWGDLLELPDVPETSVKEGNVWKLEKDKNIDKTFAFEGGENLKIAQGESWEKYMKDGVLTFYAVKKCKVELYNNSGTSVFSKGHLTAYEGETIILPDMPSSKYINYGWTSKKGGRDVEFKLFSGLRVTDDINLYMIRYTALTVTFLQPAGSVSSSMEKLNMRVVKGDKIRIPEVPGIAGYEGLGWSMIKKDTRAPFTPGKTVTVKKNLTFYAVRARLPYTVVFNNNKGTSTSKVYTSLKQYAKKNQAVILPEVPKAAGYQNLGWTTSKGKTAPLYKAGSKVKITKNTSFYAVRRKSNYYKVYFYQGDGQMPSAYKKLAMTVEEGTTITFPAVPARTGYTNKGWSSKMNSATASSLKTYTVKKNVKFYSVQKKTWTLCCIM